MPICHNINIRHSASSVGVTTPRRSARWRLRPQEGRHGAGHDLQKDGSTGVMNSRRSLWRDHDLQKAGSTMVTTSRRPARRGHDLQKVGSAGSRPPEGRVELQAATERLVPALERHRRHEHVRRGDRRHLRRRDAVRRHEVEEVLDDALGELVDGGSRRGGGGHLLSELK